MLTSMHNDKSAARQPSALTDADANANANDNVQAPPPGAAFRRNFLCGETPIEWRWKKTKGRDSTRQPRRRRHAWAGKSRITAISKIVEFVGAEWQRTGGDRSECVANIGGAVEIIHPITNRWQPLQAVYGRDGTTVKLVLVYMKTGLVVLAADAELCEDLRLQTNVNDVSDVGQKLREFRDAGRPLPLMPTRYFQASGASGVQDEQTAEGAALSAQGDEQLLEAQH